MCGNFGVLAKRFNSDKGFLPERFRSLIRNLGEATDIRGQQAGGIAVLAEKGHFVGCKIVNDKRGDLTKSLLRAFHCSAIRSRLIGRRPLERIVHVVAHYRYGTSSGPTKLETHWHRWMRPRRVAVWKVRGSEVIKQKRLVSNLITHNGDFLAWSAPKGRLAYEELGEWLGNVLGERSEATGDSPKIAGMMDLLNTQGQWEASVRLGLATLTDESLQQAGQGLIGRAFEHVFARWIATELAGEDEVSGLRVRGCHSLADLFNQNPKAVQRLSRELWLACLPLTRTWPQVLKQQRQRFIGQVVQAFFLNDLKESARIFLQRAEGTFGLVATSSLEPGVACLVSDRQPLFVATDPETGVVAYASEAAALRSVPKFGNANAPMSLPYRFDLCDGDIALIKVSATDAPNTIRLANLYSSKPPVTTELIKRFLDWSGDPSGSRRWVAQSGNPYVAERVEHGKDRVLDEMAKIPVILRKIENSWKDQGSFNCRTANSFARCFLQQAVHWERQHGDSPTAHIGAELDLLLLGVEGSLYLASAFCGDLKRVFPYLSVEAVDAAAYCGNPELYAVGTKTMTLAISHSGQSFNTVDAVKFLHELYLRGKAGPVFVMTGEVDTVMGLIVGQRIHSDSEWRERVFVTEAGRRSAEPATVSSVAIHATLTRLLLHLSQAVLDGEAHRRPPFGFGLTADDVRLLDRLSVQSIERSIALLGKKSNRWRVDTSAHSRLEREGDFLFKVLSESSVAFIFAALHLFIMLWLGWTPVAGLQSALYATSDLSIFNTHSGIGNLLRVTLETGYFLLAGAAFIFAIRWFQGRPLWDRPFTGRAIVLGDVPHVNKLLAQYVSKLFSQSYEFSGFSAIYAADPRTSDLLHVYGHRVTRGMLVFVGLPDVSWPGRSSSGAAVRMTCSQLRSVKNMKAGVTIIGVGHHEDSKRTVDRYLHLSMPALMREEGEGRRGVPPCSVLASDLQESRFASLDRLISAYVVFHGAAARTSRFINRVIPLANLFWLPVMIPVWLCSLGRVKAKLGYWDIARTQSGTLITTTASPANAISLSPDHYVPLAERIAQKSRTVAPVQAPVEEGFGDAIVTVPGIVTRH